MPSENIRPIELNREAVKNMQHIGGQRKFPSKEFINELNPKDVVKIAEEGLTGEQQRVTGEKAAAQAGVGEEIGKTKSKKRKSQKAEIQDQTSSGFNPFEPSSGAPNVDGALLSSDPAISNFYKQQQEMQNKNMQMQMMSNQQQDYQQTMNTLMQMWAERQKWWADIMKLMMDTQTYRYQKLEEAMLVRQQVMDKIAAAWNSVILGGDK